MIVLTIDQVGSRTTDDAVPELLDELESVPVIAAFERTAGDEIQGVPKDVEALYTAVRTALRHGDWHIGIGVGQGRIGSDGSTRSSSGPAFIAARQAVESAKDSRVSLAVVSADPAGSQQAARAQAVLRLLADLLQRRTSAQWEAVVLLEYGLSGKAAAQRLGISEQALSQRRIASAWGEEREAVPLALELLESLESTAASASEEPQ